jgi:hypothetical protein
MTIGEHATQFAGLPIVAFEGKTLPDPRKSAILVGLGGESYEPPEPLSSLFEKFLNAKGVDQVSTLVIGTWEEMHDGGGSEEIVKTLISAKSKLPNLKALFFGDITYEECEISWIVQTDMGPLLAAYPKLEQFRVRGGTSLSLGSLKLPALKSLIVETGGLSGTIVEQIAQSDLPELVHLELWLGDENYGADWTFEQLYPILSGKKFPKLQYLGLKDSEKADDVAIAVAQSALLQRISTLDLSMGTMGDLGGKALLTAPLQNLKKLDLHHHYLSNAVMKEFLGLAIEVNVEEQEEEDENNRYVAVGE